MDERVFSVLFNNISAVVEALEPFTPATADIHRMWYGPRGYFLLSPEGLVRRRDLIRQALRYGDWNEKFSAEYLAGRLRDIIEIHAISGADQARADFRLLVAELEAYTEQHKVFLPLFGIDIPDAPARSLGGIMFHQASADFLQRITSDDFITVPYLKRQTDAGVWAEIQVTAEPTYAVARAEQLCGPVIDVLRFWMACMTRNGTSCAIGLQGDVVTTERPRIIVNCNTGARRYDPHHSRRVPGFPLSQEVLDKLREARLDIVAPLLDKPAKNQTGFQKLLLHALHIYGSSRVQAAAADRFLNLVTCLETFLSTGDGNITQGVAEGVVMFFAVPVAERVRLKKELQQHYKTRSKISHGEHAEILADELYQLDDLVRSFLVAMIDCRDRFQSKQDLLRFLETQRLT
jgi:hypothetical protein